MMSSDDGARVTEFFEKCAQLLGVAHEGQPFQYAYRTRWNNRVAGQGRFPGRGVIRRFSDKQILVSLRDPRVHQVFESENAVIQFLTKLKLGAELMEDYAETFLALAKT